MKKFTSFLIGAALVLILLNTSATAAFTIFSDENTFADWFASSVRKMENHQIMSGNPDGEFKPTNSVNRAELAVILDRFAERVVGKKLYEEPRLCTAVFQAGLIITLQDQDGNPLEGAVISAGSDYEPFGDSSNGIYQGLYEQEGVFTFSVQKENFFPHVESVKLEIDECHVITQFKTITLVAK